MSDQKGSPDAEGRSRVVVRQSGVARPGVHAGDRRLRLTRAPEQQKIRVPATTRRRQPVSPAVVFSLGFAGFIAAGTLVLMLPVSNAAGVWTPPLVALFTATSAVCVTGLVVVDTGTFWSGFGQAAILLLIQAGGLGFMMCSSLLLLLSRRQATVRERVLLREALGAGSLGSAIQLARRIIYFTVAVEAVAIVILVARFLAVADAPTAVWWGVFHAVSAFNNAGFDVFGDFRSLTHMSTDALVVLPIALLITLGSLSYLVIEDVLRHRSFRPLALDSKLVLISAAGLLVAGTLGLLFTEWTNEATLGGMALGPRVMNALFHAVTPRSGGFSTVDVSAMTGEGLLITMALMFVGGSAGSTAGGIKLQTFGLLVFTLLAALDGSSEVHAFRRRVPMAQVLRGIAVALLSLAGVFALATVLQVTEAATDASFVDVLFEAVSAFGIVGLSTGITPTLSDPGRLVVIVTMFIGRLGPLTLALGLAARERQRYYRWAEASVRIG